MSPASELAKVSWTGSQFRQRTETTQEAEGQECTNLLNKVIYRSAVYDDAEKKDKTKQPNQKTMGELTQSETDWTGQL